jgi:FixJ family two-component response regulator
MAKPAGRIIVVDDDRSVCRALGRLLRSFGFEVQTFGSAAEVLDAGPPEDTLCLVADVRMPGMGGVELREKLPFLTDAIATGKQFGYKLVDPPPT